MILDTVNAGSCGWPYDEWKRLVNVGISRAKEFVVVLASRAEMGEPYMKPLVATLAPRILARNGRALAWSEVPVKRAFPVPAKNASDPVLLGSQLAQRKILRPVMSSDQQWLCGLDLDGKPRLVRGVAGSGKTVVLAHWLQKTVKKLAGKPDARVWAVFANKSLKDLITETIEEAWKTEGNGSSFPWERVGLFHIIDILNLLLPEVRLSMSGFDYDGAAARYLERKPFESLQPRCHAMFVDEAQDMGPNTLKLLTGLVEQSDPSDPKSRAVHIFYDNAQNVYRRKTPTWSEIGIDIRGRSTVMKESFRSTKPITEFALNFLYNFRPPESDPDHRELLKRGLVEETNRNGQLWWDVRFNQVDGPKPIFRKFRRYEKEFEAIGDQILAWVQKEGVQPKDICILYHGDWTARTLLDCVGAKWGDAGIRAVVEKSRPRRVGNDTIVLCTSNSFKGYDAEIVVIAGIEQFVVDKEILPHHLYVAMTRARSLLAVFVWARSDENNKRLVSVIEQCLNNLLVSQKVEQSVSRLDELHDLVEALGDEHKTWLEDICSTKWVEQEPIISDAGEILAEPLFWFKDDDRTYVCFGNTEPPTYTLHKLEDAGMKVISPGQTI